MNYFDRLLRAQFGKPTGRFGRMFVAPMLDRSNMLMVEMAIQSLDPCATDEVLDVGFGGGQSLLAMAERVTEGKITGVDYSPDMVAQALRLIERKRLQARVSVECGDAAHLRFPAATFEKVLTLNCLYYWPDPMAGLRELARVVKPGGRVAAGIHTPEHLRPMTRKWDNFVLYTPRELADRMENAGFERVTVEQRGHAVVVVGRGK